jgi:FkbM family methyltransferase
MYYSQAGQDKWVHDLIGDSGVFVDVGAYDGIESSNTYFLEQKGWKGICIEANVDVFQLLIKNRKSININEAVTDRKGVCMFDTDRIGGNRVVSCNTLNNILKENLFPKEIDYLSLDIEGHELPVLESIDFNTWEIKLITVEHNLYLEGTERKNKIFELLTQRGYVRTHEDVKCLDPNPAYFNQPFEDWYVKDTFYNTKF